MNRDRAEAAVLDALIDDVLSSDSIVEVIVERILAKQMPPPTPADGDVRTTLDTVEREITHLTNAIAAGGPLESLLAKLQACEQHRRELRAALDQPRHASQPQMTDRDRATLERRIRRAGEESAITAATTHDARAVAAPDGVGRADSLDAHSRASRLSLRRIGGGGTAADRGDW